MENYILKAKFVYYEREHGMFWECIFKQYRLLYVILLVGNKY